MAMPQRDELIDEIRKTDLLLEYAVQHGEVEEAERLRAKLRRLAAMGDRDETMKKLVVSFALAVAVAFATGAAVLDKAYLAADRLSFKSAAAKMNDRNVMLAVGRYDHVVPLEPIDAFWSARNGNTAVRVRKEYPTSHGFMGVRVVFAADVADFILAASSL